MAKDRLVLGACEVRDIQGFTDGGFDSFDVILFLSLAFDAFVLGIQHYLNNQKRCGLILFHIPSVPLC